MYDTAVREAIQHRGRCSACLVNELMDEPYCGEYYTLYAHAEQAMLGELEPDGG